MKFFWISLLLKDLKRTIDEGLNYLKYLSSVASGTHWGKQYEQKYFFFIKKCFHSLHPLNAQFSRFLFRLTQITTLYLRTLLPLWLEAFSLFSLSLNFSASICGGVIHLQTDAIYVCTKNSLLCSIYKNLSQLQRIE